MVSYHQIQITAPLLKDALPPGLISLFIGATSGIGESTLKHLAQVATRPRIYIVGRKAAAAAPLLAYLRQVNPEGEFKFLERDISLIKEVDMVARWVKRNEERLDLMLLSAGYIPYSGRHETTERLDASMTTRCYSRIRAIQLLLPLLNNSPNPHVVNILGGGCEGSLRESDLDLADWKNFTIFSTLTHTVTMLTLVLERFAAENPSISFVHTDPGLVATPVLTRGATGFLGQLLRWVVVPALNLFYTMSADEAGARVLFYATNARYTVSQTSSRAISLPDGLQRVGTTGKGVFLLNSKGEVTGDESLLEDFRRRGIDEKVWEHIQKIFERV